MSKEHDIIWLKSVDSTNEEAKRHISDIDNLSVLSALEQTEGRGQRGNSWTSPPGENLMFSIVLKFTLDARDQFVLTEIASLSVVDFLSRHGISAMIKWPNDIYVGEKKICGILIENSIRGKYISSSIIGIGLNVNQRNFDVNIPNPTSMVLSMDNSVHYETDGIRQIDICLCLSGFMDIFNAYLGLFLSESSEERSTEAYDSLRERYLSFLWRLNETSRFIDYTSLPSGHLDGPMNPSTGGAAIAACGIPTEQDGREFTGIIRGISPIGHLIVEDKEKGGLREFTFKGIGYVL